MRCTPPLATLVVLLVPGALSAQACLGVPTTDGRTAIAGVYTQTEGVKTFGATATVDLVGPLSVFGGLAFVDPDYVGDNGSSFGAGIAYKLFVRDLPDWSVCPKGGFTYTGFHQQQGAAEVKVSQTIVPLGVGIGKRLTGAPDLFLILAGQPQLLIVKNKVSFESGGAGAGSASDTSSEFGIDLEATVGSDKVFGGAGLGFTTIDGSDPVFSLQVGLVVGQ